MQELTNKKKIVFSIYPNANGYGFVYMENPRKLLDFGIVRINPINNTRIMERIKKSLLFFKPAIVITLDPTGTSSRTGNRVKRLIKQIEGYAKIENLNISTISRDQIRDIFQVFGVTTKHEISQALVKEFSELERMLPRRRKLWTSEDRKMAIFDALSLALSWYYLYD